MTLVAKEKTVEAELGRMGFDTAPRAAIFSKAAKRSVIYLSACASINLSRM